MSKLQKKVDFGTITVVKSANDKKGDRKLNDESAIDLINSTREISEMDINIAPILILEDEEGSLLGHQKLTINAAGLLNGSRNVKDGFAFFAKKSSTVKEFLTDREISNLTMNSTLKKQIISILMYSSSSTRRKLIPSSLGPTEKSKLQELEYFILN